MITLVTAVLFWVTTPDPGLPTIPPPLPTQITRDDGTRLTCTPEFTWCWNEQDDRGY